MNLYAFLGVTGRVMITSKCPVWELFEGTENWEREAWSDVEGIIKLKLFARFFGYVLTKKDSADLLRFNSRTLKLTGSWTMA